MDYAIQPDTYQGVCPCCQTALTSVLPVHPVFTLKTAARLIPCAFKTLESRLARHKDDLGTPIYKRDVHKRRHRYLRSWEIKYLREQLFFAKGADGTLKTLHDVLSETS